MNFSYWAFRGYVSVQSSGAYPFRKSLLSLKKKLRKSISLENIIKNEKLLTQKPKLEKRFLMNTSCRSDLSCSTAPPSIGGVPHRDNRIVNDYNYDLKMTDMALHVLELVHAAFGVALANLTEGLVLVPALADVLPVDLIHGGLLGLVARLSQIFLQGL